MTRRSFVLGATAALGGCAGVGGGPLLQRFGGDEDIDYAAIYGPLPNERFPIPAVDLSVVPTRFRRQNVAFVTPEPPGTIIVDTNRRFLYFVEEDNRATRYGVGVGAAGMAWSGRATIQLKREWPTWTPTQDMIERDPRNAEYAGGMEPGLNNPLGARALYLFQDGVDTLYRLHGSREAASIGHAVSSGCIRLLNQDVIHLYNRTPVGTTVVVRPTARDWFGGLLPG